MGEENNLTCKQRMLMTCVPCSYLNNPDIASSDYCLCCHEKDKVEHLDIPPLIEMSSTWINASTSIPTWFIITRCTLTLLMIILVIINFSLYIKDDIVGYWFIYYTQWNIIVATISMILKTISMFTILKSLKREKIANHQRDPNTQNRLYTAELQPNTKLWNLHIANDIFLQTSIPGESTVVFNYWVFVYNGSFPSPLWGFTSISVHGIGCIFIWIDFLLSAERFYYKAAFWPVFLGTIFTIWSLIFTAAGLTDEYGNPYIYAAYDWSSSAIKPIGMYFATVVIIIIFSTITAFVKNLILIKSDIGTTMIRLKQQQKNDIESKESAGDGGNRGNTEIGGIVNDATDETSTPPTEETGVTLTVGNVAREEYVE